MPSTRSFHDVDSPVTPVRAALRAVEARVRPDFRKAVVFALLALVADGVAHGIGGVHASSTHVRLAAYGCGVAFLGFGVLAARAVAGELSRASGARGGAAAALPVRVGALLLGYLLVLLGALDLFDLPVGHLLVGGAVTGVILGIAAQQTLGNLFAGLVLLFARPYTPGERIRVRSGSMGGPLDGTVTSVGLVYTTMLTEDGPVNMPNGVLLGSAVGPLVTPPAGRAGQAAGRTP